MENKLEVVYLDIESLYPMVENPNMQTDLVFNSLIENIRTIGMSEPIMVAPVLDGDKIVDGEYKIVSGHHRYEACKILGYSEIPCIVQQNFDEDMSKFQLVRMNMLKGKLDPLKFTQLYNDMAEKYGEELTKTSMGLVDEKAFQKLYLQVREELPKEMKKKMDESKDEIKSVDDLSRTLNEMFSKYGDTLKNNFMIFKYGGKSHVWVNMDSDLKKTFIDNFLVRIKAEDLDITDFFKVLLTEYGNDALLKTKKLEGTEEIKF